MISILIPVYNFDLTSMVSCLSNAIEDSEIYNEIIIGDDGCEKSYRSTFQKLARLKKVRLLVSEKNIGRAAIRNRLAEIASCDYLLYIDADALIPAHASQYLDKWVNYMNTSPVVCGGTAYRDVPPDDPDRYLRWQYGYYKEQKYAKKRNRKPYASFSGFNFLIEKEVLKRVRFNEELRNYGHEDTLLGYQLMKAGIPLLHIDNQLIHDGLDNNREFIIKTREGVQNLSILYDKVTDKKALIRSVKLLRVFKKLHTIGITRVLALIYKKNKRRIEVMLRSRKSSLKIFSVYKLGLFCYYRHGYK